MKILIVQLRRIGDILVTTPVIDVLRRQFPDATIDFLAEPMGEPVLRQYPGLNEALIFDKKNYFSWLRRLRQRKYDWVLDFMNNPRSAQMTWISGAPVRAGFDVPLWGRVYTHRIPRPVVPLYAVQNKFLLLKVLGVPTPSDLLPHLTLSPDDFSGAASWWSRHQLDSFEERIALLPAHRHAIRQWPQEKFEKVRDRLLTHPRRAILLFGGPGEEKFLSSFLKGGAPVFQIPGGPLRQAASVLRRCQAAVTNDSGLMHLAVSVGVPTVTLYGPTNPISWNPRRPPHRYVRAEGLACLGCNRDRCPYHHECMQWIPAERVADLVEDILMERKPRVAV